MYCVGAPQVGEEGVRVHPDGGRRDWTRQVHANKLNVSHRNSSIILHFLSGPYMGLYSKILFLICAVVYHVTIEVSGHV